MSSKQKNNNNIVSSNLPIPLFLILCLHPPHVTAQPSPPSSPPYTDFNPSIIAIIVILVAALFLMAFFSIYIRRHATDATSVIIQRTGTIRGPFHGLDSSVIDTFPTFVYSTVKGLKIGKGALECAVCLNEYEDDEMLRLIPKCDHVFHPDCIDAWFKSHVTCPVCRANLVPDSEQNESVSVSVSVVVDDPTVNVEEPESLNTLNPLNRDQSVVKPGVFDKFRSHSTGHSLGENMERFTLRLPEDVRKQVVNRALLNRVGESSGKKGFRTGGGVSGRRRSYKRLESVAVRSERWVLPRAPSFLTRAFSIRSPRVVSGNPEPSASSRTADNIPLNNIGPKSC